MRLGNTMREAILSTMASSDMELDARGRDFITNITKKKRQMLSWGNQLEAGAVQDVGRTSPVDF